MIRNRTLQDLRKNLKKDLSIYPKLKIALLGDNATQLLSTAIRSVGVEEGLNIEIFESDYDQISLAIEKENSELYTFNPEYVIIFHSAEKFQKNSSILSLENNLGLADELLKNVERHIRIIKKRLTSKIIVFNLAHLNHGVFGNYSSKLSFSVPHQIRKFNYLLDVLSQKVSELYILDINKIQVALGLDLFSSCQMLYNNSIVLTTDATVEVANNVLSIIQSNRGNFKKCIILDLDNTLWGGVIGDDGLSGIHLGELGVGKIFVEFQRWLKQLQLRGIILAVSSKNTEGIAKEVFEKHPDMILKLEDITVFRSNWRNKAENIRYIQEVLNIGFDSMVFIDDNPMERALVRENLPNICVPEMPEDPAEYLRFIQGLNLFETASYSSTDKLRASLYKAEFERKESMMEFVDEASFLDSLKMIANVSDLNEFNLSRVSQLTLRSNQFNLRTKRYDKEQIERISRDDKYNTFNFSLRDKFGDHGLICVVITERKNADTLFIDTWLMSCRVLNREMEFFVMNHLIRFARENNVKFILGEYIETKKNVIVKDLFKGFGFVETSRNFWKLVVNDSLIFKSKINYGKE